MAEKPISFVPGKETTQSKTLYTYTKSLHSSRKNPSLLEIFCLRDILLLVGVMLDRFSMANMMVLQLL